jgi:tetraacyldisaccharide 4'-kinase
MGPTPDRDVPQAPARSSPSGSPHGRAALERALQRLWFGPARPSHALIGLLLRPLGALVAQQARARRRSIAQAKGSRAPGAPTVIVVGNFTVGGTGKTPLLIALARALSARGLRVGVIARGHGGAQARTGGHLLPDAGLAADYGDEPVLIRRETGLPVAVGHDRRAALDALLAHHPDCQLVLSDDGLQHARLHRDLELAVFDRRGAGNGRCLPAGPLREPLDGARLMDALVLNGPQTPAPLPHARTFRFEVKPVSVASLDGRCHWTPEAFAAQVHGEALDALAGIGAPQRFFDTLQALGLAPRTWPLADHAAIDPRWLAGLPGRWLIMTAKDAVKCASFDEDLRARCVELRIEAVLDPALIDWLEERLHG